MTINLSNLTEHKLNLHERIMVGLGLTMVFITDLIALFSYALAPTFTGKSWLIATPGLHLLSFITGVILFLIGSNKLIKAKAIALDSSYDRFLVYRVSRWTVLKFFGLIWTVVSFIFFVWIDESPSPNDGSMTENKRERTVDDMWELHPEHYYDNDPPPPFS